jgi:hypothetical protein
MSTFRGIGVESNTRIIENNEIKMRNHRKTDTEIKIENGFDKSCCNGKGNGKYIDTKKISGSENKQFSRK